MKRFITRDWLAWEWRWANLKICWVSQSPRPRSSDFVLAQRPAGSRPMKSQGFSSSSKSRVKQIAQFKAVRKDDSLFLTERSSSSCYSGLQLIGRGSPTLRRVLLLYSVHWLVSSSETHPDRHTQDNIWPNVSVPHGPVKWTHKISLHGHNT